jgi:DNA repair exonuclease SbcCD ATPase subunit
MITFRYVKWSNFLSTGNLPTTVQLDNNTTTLIIGENGAGKSTILDALCFGLFGKPYRPIKKAQLVNSINARDALVTVDFKIGTNDFQVIRGIKPNIFQIWRNGKELDQDAHSKDFQKTLEDSILKLNYKSFTQVVILGSSCFVPFMQLPTSHRREVVEDILDIKIFSIMNILLKQDYKEMNTELQDLMIDDRINRNELSLEQSHLDGVEKDSDKRIKVLELEQEKHVAEIVEKVSRTETLEEKIINLDTLQSDSVKLGVLKIKLESKTNSTEKKIKFFNDNNECDVCEQSIEPEFKKTRVPELESKVTEYSGALGEMTTELNRVSKIINDMKHTTNVIYSLKSEIKGITGLLERCRRDLKVLTDDKHQTDTLKEKIESLKGKIKHTESAATKLKEENFYLDICKNLLHDTGIKSKIIKQYLPVMNQTIQKYLGILDFYINFTLNEQFEETIKSRYRDEFSYASFSEGEKMRIDLALMFTWREIARLKNSTNTNLLILDEIFDSSLDATGTDDFLKILNSLESQNIFVISHKGDILFDKFSHITKFVKHKNFSKIDES